MPQKASIGPLSIHLPTLDIDWTIPASSNFKDYEYYPTENLVERIWTPSASEMGVLPPTNKAEAAKQGDTYIWFTNNESRVKLYNGFAERYWTRTWEGTSQYRLYGVGFDGGYGYDINSTHSMGIFTFESAGLIFGFCV